MKVQQPVDICGGGVCGATVVFTNAIPGVVVVTAYKVYSKISYCQIVLSLQKKSIMTTVGQGF